MKKIKCAVFDLDGTLVNTIDDLSGACNKLIEKYSFDAQWTVDDYKKFVGNGARKLVSRAFKNSLTDAELDARFAEFKEIYNKTKLDNACVYEGVTEQLEMLKDMGVKLCVVTNKPHEAARGMVEHFFSEGFFDVISGLKDGVAPKPDPASTLAALSEVGCKPSEAIYFGDSEVDMQTAKNAGIEAVGVSWGFRSFSTLFAQNPSIIIDEPKYISKLF